MSQDDQSIANAAGATVRADINSNLVALHTLSSGASAPSTTRAGMLWYDTTNAVVKQRDATNSSWITRWTVANAEGVFTTTITAAAINASGNVTLTGGILSVKNGAGTEQGQFGHGAFVAGAIGVGAVNATPLVFAVSSTEVGRFATSGLFTAGFGAAVTGALDVSSTLTAVPGGASHFKASGGRVYVGGNSSALGLALGYSKTRTDAAQTVFVGATDSATPDMVFANVSGTTLATFATGGAVTFPAVGTTASAANAYLDNAASNNLLRSTSSLVYKTAVEPMDPAHAREVVDKLRAIWFRSLCEADPKDWSYYGLGAEEVAKVDPRFVFYTRRVTGTTQEDYFEDEPVMEDREVQRVDIVEGKAVLRTEIKRTQVIDTLPVVDEAGNPVMNAQAVFDEEGNQVAVNYRQTTAQVPRTVSIKKTREVPVYGELVPDGVQYDRLGVPLLVVVQKLLADFEAYKAAHP